MIQLDLQDPHHSLRCIVQNWLCQAQGLQRKVHYYYIYPIRMICIRPYPSYHLQNIWIFKLSLCIK